MTTHQPLWDPSFGDAPVPPGEITVEGPLVVGPGGDVSAIPPTIQLTGTGTTRASAGDYAQPDPMASPHAGSAFWPSGAIPDTGTLPFTGVLSLDGPLVVGGSGDVSAAPPVQLTGPGTTGSTWPTPMAGPHAGGSFRPSGASSVTAGSRPYHGGIGVLFSSVNPLVVVSGTALPHRLGSDAAPTAVYQVLGPGLRIQPTAELMVNAVPIAPSSVRFPAEGLTAVGVPGAVFSSADVRNGNVQFFVVGGEGVAQAKPAASALWWVIVVVGVVVIVVAVVATRPKKVTPQNWSTPAEVIAYIDKNHPGERYEYLLHYADLAFRAWLKQFLIDVANQRQGEEESKSWGTVYAGIQIVIDKYMNGEDWQGAIRELYEANFPGTGWRAAANAAILKLRSILKAAYDAGGKDDVAGDMSKAKADAWANQED